ncbi:MAG TPA: glycogen/starch/alpha-glucan family phosphorylase [Candidatus Bariatricus faecipullorum]|nr:glycogen/starch/alpha-glucan family phosphorylase [Candidatus Bariatricus faecipullorum]
MLEARLTEIMRERWNTSIEEGTAEQVYHALMTAVKEEIQKKEEISGNRKLYYISMEFLMGKLLSNNLINLGLYEEAREVLEKHGKKLAEIEEAEPEPSLGNGGLGRLAACFLDSIASLGLPGDGVGLRYHMGLFRQVFENHCQKEVPDPWLEAESWLADTGSVFDVPFGGFSLKAHLYDLDVAGYENGRNKLHLFDVETVDESIVHDGITFDKQDIGKNLTLFLYPDDSDEAGNLLRIYQEYFMVSAAAQLIIKECREKGWELRKLHEHVAVQINDTHPSMVIPELVRLLVENQIDFNEALEIVQKTCAYTNHTILAEALETWPVESLEKVVPQIVPIIREMDMRIRGRYQDSRVHIIDDQGRVHMAHMDIHYGYSVNGVARLHTEILKNEELKPFYDIYPEKFNNKTNGITFRRWLLHCNHELAGWLDGKIGTAYRKDARKLEELLRFQEDPAVLKELLAVKQQKKEDLAAWLRETRDVDISPDSVFDIQIKRLHEYKRQQMNALYAAYKYLEIKGGKKPERPITMIFGAKAAPAYTIAKDIIHFLLCLQELTASDPDVSTYFRVIMVENYNVTVAEKLIPACDISEQISLASKEASGTGNMKFMLNGAVTLGTEDGANVEIHELVGDENIFIFGRSSQEVIDHYRNQDYRAVDYYINDEEIRKLVDFIISPEILKIGNPWLLLELHAELIRKDWFMTLLDVKEYIQKKEEALAAYENREEWAKKMLVNIAKAGYFSSDRTIEEYNRDIWKLE